MPALPWRLGYGYEPPSQGLIAWLRSSGAEFSQVPLQDSPAITSAAVDATLRDVPGSVNDEYVAVSYDPEIARSRQVALAVGKMIGRYPGGAARPLYQPVSDVPVSYHVFFTILLPLLMLIASGLGVLLARSTRIRGRLGAGLTLVAALFLVLTIQLPGWNFPGNEGQSVFLGEYLGSLAILPLAVIGLILAAPLALALASIREIPRIPRAWWAVGTACLTVVCFWLATAWVYDGQASSWPLTQVSGWLAAPGLLAFGLMTFILRRQLV